MDGNNQEADKTKYVYTWKPHEDYEWKHENRFTDPKPLPAPIGKCFAVIVSPNIRKDEFDDVDFWIESWSWIEADSQFADRPINWLDRYEELLK